MATRRFRELVSSGHEMSVKGILGELEAIEGSRALKYKPVFESEEKVTLHEHFLPTVKRGADGELVFDSRKTAKALDKMWARVRKSGLKAVAVLTHSFVDRELVMDLTGERVRFNPEYLYDMADKSVPADLRGGGFCLIPAVEFRVGNVELVVLGPDRDSVFGNGRIWDREAIKSVEDLAKAVHDDGRLVAFFPHPFLENGGAANERNLGVDGTRRLMHEYGIGVEYNGMFRELEIARRRLQPLLRVVGGVRAFGSTVAAIGETVAQTDLLPILCEDAPAVSVGGDFHLPERHIGEAAMVVRVSRRARRLPLDESYTVSEGPSGFVLLTASGKAMEEAEVIDAKSHAQDVLDSLRGSNNQKAVLPGYDQSLFKTFTIIAADMVFGHMLKENILFDGK